MNEFGQRRKGRGRKRAREKKAVNKKAVERRRRTKVTVVESSKYGSVAGNASRSLASRHAGLPSSMCNNSRKY